MNVLGIDLGGTAVKGAVVNELGEILLVAERPTMATGGRQTILDQLSLVIRDLMVDSQPEAIGIASAGRIDSDAGIVVYATENLPGWQGLRLTEEVESRFHLPVYVDNDANLAAYGEVWVGAGHGLHSLVALTLGTGVGGGVIIDGRILHGAHWSAAELGHAILHPEGLQCNCGQRGCLEQYVSGSALLKAAREATHNDGLALSEFLFVAHQGEPRALTVLDGFAADLALALYNLRNQFDPDVMLLGGGVAESRDLIDPLLRKHLVEYNVDIQVEWGTLGNRAGIVGAARIALDGQHMSH